MISLFRPSFTPHWKPRFVAIFISLAKSMEHPVMKKLVLKDRIARLEDQLLPDIIA